MWQYRVFILSVTIFAAVIGCSKSGQTPVTLSGTVTYKGVPLKGGYMAFHTDNHGIINTTIDQDGHYEVKLPTDSIKVTIETESFNPDKTSPTYGPQTAGGNKASPAKGEAAMKSERMKAEGKGGGEGGSGGFGPPPKEELAKRYTKIPQKYAFKETSGFTLQLDSGKHVKDYELTD